MLFKRTLFKLHVICLSRLPHFLKSFLLLLHLFPPWATSINKNKFFQVFLPHWSIHSFDCAQRSGSLCNKFNRSQNVPMAIGIWNCFSSTVRGNSCCRFVRSSWTDEQKGKRKMIIRSDVLRPLLFKNYSTAFVSLVFNFNFRLWDARSLASFMFSTFYYHLVCVVAVYSSQDCPSSSSSSLLVSVSFLHCVQWWEISGGFSEAIGQREKIGASRKEIFFFFFFFFWLYVFFSLPLLVLGVSVSIVNINCDSFDGRIDIITKLSGQRKDLFSSIAESVCTVKWRADGRQRKGKERYVIQLRLP